MMMMMVLMLLLCVRHNHSLHLYWYTHHSHNNYSIYAARALYKRALAISPTSLHTINAWAQLEKDQGNYPEALRLLKKALIAAPERVPTSGRDRTKNRSGSRASGGAVPPPPERFNSSRILQSIADVIELQLEADGSSGRGDRVRAVYREGEKAAIQLGDAGYFQVIFIMIDRSIVGWIDR